MGFHGLPVILQYAVDDGPVKIHNFWTTPIKVSLNLIKWMMEHGSGITAFNIAFDMFHLNKVYNVFNSYHDHDELPINIIEELALLEPGARDGLCVKPIAACDLMLHAKRGPYQSLMDRKPIRIKRVPTPIAFQLAAKLEENIKLKDIYFASFKDKTRKRWQVHDIEKADGKIDPNFKDIVLRFAPSVGLKALAVDALNLPVTAFKDIQPKYQPNELGYAPYALAVGKPGAWNGAWPIHVKDHVKHWEENEEAKKYAIADITMLRDLYKYFDCPSAGDTNSTLACMVAAVRWRGMSINVEGITKLRDQATKEMEAAPKSPKFVRKYIWPLLSANEVACLDSMKGGAGTGKVVIEAIAKFTDDDDKPTEAALRAKKVMEARKAEKRKNLFDKLLLAGRFHVSFKVIGTLSERMSGSDQLNAQGIDKLETIRQCFPLAWPGMQLDGGDFASFEVTIAEAEYKDPELRKDLTEVFPCDDCDTTGIHRKCAGKGCKKCKKTGKCDECKGTGHTPRKIHGLFAQFLFPGKSYREIVKSKGSENDMYDKGKRAIFSQFYGGNEQTIVDRIDGVNLEDATRAAQAFGARYRGVARSRMEIYNDFCSMRQEGGIGSKVTWANPKDFVECMLGPKRYFTLENKICKYLFDLANDPPKEWTNIRGQVVRRDRYQSNAGATRSALFAAAFNVQSQNMRAASNHKIQAVGARATKEVQVDIWSLQPIGVNPWKVISMNVHDEIMNSVVPELSEQLEKIVKDKVETFRPLIPLIQIDWKRNMSSWAEK